MEKRSRELPILFNAGMMLAVLDNRKTATRRTIKGIIPNDAIWEYTGHTPKGYISCRGTFPDGYGEKFFKLPCQPGDYLYVRETWAFAECITCDGAYRRPENAPPCYDTQAVEYDDGDSISEGCFIYCAGFAHPERITWRPSIHMPKAAARIWLKVTDVKVKRLQSMTTVDFWREGVVIRPEAYNDPDNAYWQLREQFADIWDATLKESDLNQYCFHANPWIWVIEFKRCKKPEDID